MEIKRTQATQQDLFGETSEIQISIKEAAEFASVSQATIRNWIKKTDIPAHKIGKLWKFKRVELDAWVKSGRSAIE